MQTKPILALLAAGALAASPLALAAGDKGAAYGGGGSMQQTQAQGQEAEAVKKIQQSLNDQGYSAGPVDGIIGEKTRGALSEFQQAEGMQATGEVDRQTIDALGLDPEASEFSAFVEDQGAQDQGGAMQDGGMMQDDGMMQDGGGMQQSPGVDSRENGMGSPGTP
jgi:peptidoglycan hydrolase-like protein with peptidoglycan-binding domain